MLFTNLQDRKRMKSLNDEDDDVEMNRLKLQLESIVDMSNRIQKHEEIWTSEELIPEEMVLEGRQELNKLEMQCGRHSSSDNPIKSMMNIDEDEITPTRSGATMTNAIESHSSN